MSVDAHIMKKKYGSIDSLITYGHSSKMKKEVENRRQVLLRIIDIIKLIGKQGLSYRAKNNEAAYTLINPSLDHGNFLEMILLVGKYDPILKAHLVKSIKNSIKSHNNGSKQGGGYVNFLSKTTVNHIIDIISKKIKSFISKEVIEAGIFSTT